MFLCVDFDGVLVDGADECLIVSWLAWNNKGIPSNLLNLLNSIPDEFHNKFRILRNYVRYDAHFIAPYIISSINSIEGQKDFDSIFSAIDDDLIKQFTKNFQTIRTALRKNHPDEWFASHTLYPGIQSIFNTGHKLFIVSGKDTESIKAIFEHHNISIDTKKIYGSLKSKKEVLKTLFTLSKNNNTRMIFCDDNLPNVIESKTLGITTFWAGWGYHTEEHIELAKKESIKVTSLAEFISIVQKQDL